MRYEITYWVTIVLFSLSSIILGYVFSLVPNMQIKIIFGFMHLCFTVVIFRPFYYKTLK